MTKKTIFNHFQRLKMGNIFTDGLGLVHVHLQVLQKDMFDRLTFIFPQRCIDLCETRYDFCLETREKMYPVPISLDLSGEETMNV